MLYQSEILAAALKYNVTSDWLKAIITQESRFDPYALRYEEKYSYLYKVKEMALKCRVSTDTETQEQKFSWGLGQLMGALVREQGFTEPMGRLFEPVINIDHIAIRLRDLMKKSPVDTDVFAMYNGGIGALSKKTICYPNQSYVDSVKKHLQSFQ